MKFVKFFLCIALLIGSANCVYAAEDNGITEALQQVKERIDTSEYDDFRSSFYRNEDGTASYYFNWSKKDTGNAGLYINISDGIITSYGKYDYDKDDDFNAFSMTENEAVEIAQNFINKINPEICENIKIVANEHQSVQDSGYMLRIYREEENTPVLNETGYITVSKNAREVSDFYITYTSGITFKTLEGIINENDAKDAYKKQIAPSLRYTLNRDYYKKEQTAYIEYASKNGFVINAYDGSVYDIYTSDGTLRSTDDAKEEFESGAGLTPAEYEETERIAGLLSEEQAEDILRKNRIIAISDSYKREYSSLQRNWFNKNDYIYNFSFVGKDEEYISAGINAKTGEILRFYKYYDYDKNGVQERKREEQSAENALKTLAGEKADEFRLAEGDNTGEIRYIRSYDGVDVNGDGAYIDFDQNDNITGYHMSYTEDVEFPSKNGAISSDEALDSAFEKLGFSLAYAINDKNKTAQPIYYVGKDAQSESFTMNPFSGNITDYNGEDMEEEKEYEYSDIENHYGKEAFLELAKYGIGFDGGELKPDEPITQAEYFKLLNSAFGYETDMDSIYEQMIMYGIMPAGERADDSTLTREKAAIFMIREIGAEEYAKFNEIFETPFSDVYENKGYIAILKAKKIVNGDGTGNFNPQKMITRGEALIMIHNYFTK